MAVQIQQSAGTRHAGVKRHLITLDEYEQMIEAGLFDAIFRLELIKGELIEHMPPGPAHESCVARIHLIFSELLQRRALIWPHGNSVGLPESNSRPQPDLTLLRWRDDLYSGKRPAPEDVIVLVEVSKSTLAFDQHTKLDLYAEAGVAEYWIANLVDGTVEVYKDPGAGKYKSMRTYQRDEVIQLSGHLAGEIAVTDILG